MDKQGDKLHHISLKVQCSYQPSPKKPKRKRYKVKIRLRENLFQGNWLIALECIATGVSDGQKRLVGIVTNLSRHLNSKGETVMTALKYVALGSYKDQQEDFTTPTHSAHSNLPRIWLPVTHPSEFLIFSTVDLGIPLIPNGFDIVYATFVLKKAD